MSFLWLSSLDPRGTFRRRDRPNLYPCLSKLLSPRQPHFVLTIVCVFGHLFCTEVKYGPLEIYVAFCLQVLLVSLRLITYDWFSVTKFGCDTSPKESLIASTLSIPPV